MKKESLLIQEYKNLKCQATPELWSRIEANLKEHPERELAMERDIPSPKTAKGSGKDQWWRYGIAVAAAFLLIVSVARPMSHIRFGHTRSSDSEGQEFSTSQGVLYYSQLDLSDCPSLLLPAKSVTVPEDTMYFSEELLSDTQLLCLGTVTSVSLETNQTHGAIALVYEVSLENVCYSEDYSTDLTHLTIKSPIVSASGKDNQILYQLKEEETYLLPLKKQAGDWELLFPFAPQIQVTETGAYLFHSGYNSLIDDQTFVVVKEQEGTNDFYYDRMLLREDGEFLSDYISLIMR